METFIIVLVRCYTWPYWVEATPRSRRMLKRRSHLASQVRRAVGTGIVWSAATTAGAFLCLILGGLPGLAQLGTIVLLPGPW